MASQASLRLAPLTSTRTWRPEKNTFVSERFELALSALLVLNAVDASLTLLWIQIGAAQESNPLLACVAHANPLHFMLIKVSLVSLGVLLLRRCSTSAMAIAAVGVGLTAYVTVCAYHCLFAARLGVACCLGLARLG